MRKVWNLLSIASVLLASASSPAETLSGEGAMARFSFHDSVSADFGENPYDRQVRRQVERLRSSSIAVRAVNLIGRY